MNLAIATIIIISFVWGIGYVLYSKLDKIQEEIKKLKQQEQ
jgi:hypothetical protein